MTDVGGGDATEAFEDVGHSDEAREQLSKLLVGTLKRMVRTCSHHNFRNELLELPSSTHLRVHRPTLSAQPPPHASEVYCASHTKANMILPYSLAILNLLHNPIYQRKDQPSSQNQQAWALDYMPSSLLGVLLHLEHINTYRPTRKATNKRKI